MSDAETVADKLEGARARREEAVRRVTELEAEAEALRLKREEGLRAALVEDRPYGGQAADRRHAASVALLLEDARSAVTILDQHIRGIERDALVQQQADIEAKAREVAAQAHALEADYHRLLDELAEVWRQLKVAAGETMALGIRHRALHVEIHGEDTVYRRPAQIGYATELSRLVRKLESDRRFKL